MKKRLSSLFAALLVCTLALSLCGCGGTPAGPTVDPTPTPTPVTTATPTPTPTPTPANPYEDGFPAHDFAAGYDDLEEMKKLADSFGDCIEEFTDASSLSDAAKFFAAARYLSSSFTQLEDGYSSSLPLSLLEEGVAVIFGRGVSLSEGWAAGDYSPFTVDTAAGTVVSHGHGGLTRFYYVWACTETAEGDYQLWLLDLLDPLFADDPANADLVATGKGDAVPYESIKELAPQLQTNVYTFAKSTAGLVLTGFEYRNFKNVEHIAA